MSFEAFAAVGCDKLFHKKQGIYFKPLGPMVFVAATLVDGVERDYIAFRARARWEEREGHSKNIRVPGVTLFIAAQRSVTMRRPDFSDSFDQRLDEVAANVVNIDRAKISFFRPRTQGTDLSIARFDFDEPGSRSDQDPILIKVRDEWLRQDRLIYAITYDGKSAQGVKIALYGHPQLVWGEARPGSELKTVLADAMRSGINSVIRPTVACSGGEIRFAQKVLEV